MAPTKSSKSIISVTLKLKLRPAQERMLNRWLWHLSGVYNWAVRKIELDAKDRVYWSRYDLEALIVGHSTRMAIPLHTLRHTVRRAHLSWSRCFKKLGRKPGLKGRRNRLNSFVIAQGVHFYGDKIQLGGIGLVRVHRMNIPNGLIKHVVIVKRASGWHACLVVEAAPAEINAVGYEKVGIDPGFSSLLALSSGELIEHPHELINSGARLAQAQRGHRRILTARLHERVANQRKDRNHKLSRRLVSENALIAWSKDSHRSIAKRFGKSVASAAHGYLREMLARKSSQCGREFIEVPSRNSTRTCSSCGALSGPSGLAGLKVRHWACACGATHERDVNAARNTLNAALGMSVEMGREAQSVIAL